MPYMTYPAFQKKLLDGEGLGIPREVTYNALKSQGYEIEKDPSGIPIQQKQKYDISELKNPEDGSFLGNVARSANREIIGFGRGLVDRIANPSKLGGDVKNLATLAGGTIAGAGENIYQAVTGRQVPQFNPDMTISYPEGGTKEQQIAGAVGQSILGAVKHPIKTFEDNPIMTSLIVVPALRTLSEGVGLTPKLSELAGQAKTYLAEKKALNAVKMLPEITEKGISKSIRPSITGKKTYSDISKFYDNAGIATQTIVKNKSALQLTNEFGEVNPTGLPQSLQQFSDAIDQTKKVVYQQYNDLSRQAGGVGAKVDTSKVAEELVSAISDPKFAAIEDQSPELADYILKRASALERRGFYSPEQAEVAIKNYNDSLASFYKNPSVETFQRTTVDAMIVNNLRKALDDTIMNATGEQYSILKKQYGALKAIEKDTLNAAMVNARKNAKGLIDFTKIFSAGDLVAGLATGNPLFAVKGGLQIALAKYFKFLNDPNNVVKNMFQKIDSALTGAEDLGITGASRPKILPQQPLPTLEGMQSQSPTIPPVSPLVNPIKSPKKK